MTTYQCSMRCDVVATVTDPLRAAQWFCRVADLNLETAPIACDLANGAVLQTTDPITGAVIAVASEFEFHTVHHDNGRLGR